MSTRQNYMRKTISWRKLCLLVIATITMCFLFATSAFASTIASGTCGTCPWYIDDSYTLTFNAGTLNDMPGFFNDITHPWLSDSYRTKIKKVVVNSGVKANGGLALWFYGMSGCTEMDLRGLDTRNATSFWDTFEGCSSLTTIKVGSNFKTNNVEDMSGMFYGCKSLTSLNNNNLNIRNFDTSNVTSMSSMFNGCKSLTSIDVSTFNTSKVTSMNSMFMDCQGLTALNINNFDTGNVANMGSMFRRCYSLPSISYRDSFGSTGKVTNMSYMFAECSNLTSIDVSHFNTSNVKYMNNMFSHSPKITTLDISHFDTGKVEYIYEMFNGCRGLRSIDVSSFDTSKVKSLQWLFQNCSSLTSIDVSSFVTSDVTNMYGMFSGCSSIESLNISSFDTSKVTNMGSMFANCSSLKSVNLGSQFKFSGNNITADSSKAILPDPPTTSPYSGKWTKEDETAGPYTASELRTHYDSNPGLLAGTWVWEVPPSTYRIEFSIPDGISGSMTPQTVEPDEAYTLEKQKFYKFGYTFKYWLVDGSSTTYQDRATIPANTYTAGTTVTLIPVFEAINTTLSMANNEMDLYLNGSEKATFANVPAGTAYQVWEETPSGWRLISQSNVSGKIEPLQTSTASFVNEYAPGTVTATICGSKILDGKAAAAGAYQFQLVENGSVLQTVYNQDGGFISFDPITYTGVGTHTYTVREVNGGNSGIQYDSHTETITVSVTQDGEGVLQTSVTYDSDGINFVNTTKPGVLEIIKQAIGITQANSNSTFTFNVILQNGDGTLSESGYAWHVENVA